ncbi:MAG: PIN domain-containing protein [Chloroflexi bacterium]|nr:PIN domain-containing protein [Chloroflexota bacterium]
MTLDTSGLLALFDRKDPELRACLAVFEEDGGPYLVSVAILSEVAWFFGKRFPSRVEDAFLDDLERDAYTLDWDKADARRIHQLTKRYRDLGLGIADAAVVACAERNGGRILTTDWRHFPVVARGEKSITVLPVSRE